MAEDVGMLSHIFVGHVANIVFPASHCLMDVKWSFCLGLFYLGIDFF